MKLLIISDTHSRTARLRAVLDMHKDADALIFLGDGISDLERVRGDEYPFTIFCVRGNCDVLNASFGNLPIAEEGCVTLGGYKLLFMHGHTRGVKSSMVNAVYAARELEADVLLYGHTHIPQEGYFPPTEKSKALYVFNPGSLGDDGSFGLVQIQNGNILFSHGKL